MRGLGRARRSGNVILIILAVLIGLAILAALVAGGLWWYFRRAAAGFMDQALQMAPQETQVYLAINAQGLGFDQQRQQRFLEVWRKSSAFQKINQQLQDELGMTLEEDFLTWITPTAVLIAAPSEGKKSVLEDTQGDAPGFRLLLAVGVRDEGKARESVERLKGKSGVQYRQESYGGAVIEVPESEDKGPAFAFHKGLLLIGTTSGVKMGLDGLGGKGSKLTANPRYTQAVAKLKNKEGVVGWVDLQSLLAAIPWPATAPGQVKQLVGSLKDVVVGGGTSGKEMVFDYYLLADVAGGGPLAQKVFSPAFDIDLASAGLLPDSTQAYAAFNLRMLWDILYEMAGAFPQGRAFRELPREKLAQRDIDLARDILDPLTGELGFAVQDYGKFAARMEESGQGSQMRPQEVSQALSETPFVVILGLKDEKKIQDLISRLVPPPMMGMLAKKDHQGTTIYSTPGAPPFSFAYVQSNLVLSINQPGAIEAIIDAAKGGKTLKDLPGYQEIIKKVGSDRLIALRYEDVGAYAQQAATELGQGNPEAAELYKFMAETFGRGWGAATVTQDGIYGVSTLELK
ncbi:MAG TPA: DUF3352 domain-containing protein [Candidatus Nitrosotenuis sp.]|jgi:hypothetical protein|nr:DUF3352 domain-containing protein [Candidatus Nitrosotenuis sp.]